MSSHLYGSKEDEIAALEAQLKALKEEQPASVDAAVPASSSVVDDNGNDDNNENQPVDAATERKWTVDAGRFAAPPSGSAVDSEGEPYAEMLTESWKARADSYEKDQQEGLLNTVGKLAAVVAAVAVLVVFSQIPVGQENYDRYSTAKPNMSIDLGDVNRID